MGTAPITDRDRRMVAFAAEHRFVLAAHIATLLGISPRAATDRMRTLCEDGYLVQRRLFRDEPSHYQVTTRGLRAVGSDLSRPPATDLSLYRHEAGQAWLTVAAHRGMFGPLRQIISERQMRSRDGRAGEGEEPLGVRIGGVGRGGRPRLHYPDLLVVSDSGHRIAFELELTLKEPRRRERILAAYAGDQRIDAVVYLVDHPARRRAMQESVRRVGIADRVRVERVTLGHDPPASSARANDRTSRRSRATRRPGVAR